MNRHSHQPNKNLRVLVAPDSFKGSLDAADVAARIAAGLRSALPGCIITEAPIADGGEGTASAVARALGGSWHTVTVANANGQSADVPFAACHSQEMGSFAIVDVADIVGLPHAVQAPGQRTTKGIGQAIRAIAQLGHKTIVLGLGGSSTNDGGAGMLAELAFRFADAAGTTLDPVFDTLPHIRSVAWREDAQWLDEVQLIGLTDVTSPLTGPQGASMIFGAQKGFADLQHADGVLHDFSRQCTALLQTDFADIEGAGAAGGLGYGICMLGGKLRPGASFILDALRLTQGKIGYDWIITGEGRSDRQTLLGKGPALVAQLARRNGIPVTLLSGAIEYDSSLDAAFDGCFSVQSGPVTLQYAMDNAGDLLENASRQLAALFGRALAYQQTSSEKDSGPGFK